MEQIVILSGKGGTGKTSLSAAFATMDPDSVVADCDVDTANLHLVLQPENITQGSIITGARAVIDETKCTRCGLCVDLCRFGAISKVDYKIHISETSCDGCHFCSRVCPAGAIKMVPGENSWWFISQYRNGILVHARLTPGQENTGKLVDLVREKAKQVAIEKNIETLFIDGPPGTGCPVISSVTGTDKAILVTEPTQTAFHDLKRIIEVVNNFKVKPFVVVNKYDLNLEMASVIEDWCQQNSIELAGRLPFNEAVVAAMVNCKSILEWQPDSGFSAEIRSILHKVITKK